MGLSGLLLRDINKFDIDKLIKDIKSASKSAGLLCMDGLEYEKYDDGTYIYLTFHIMDKKMSDNQLLFYVYNDIRNMRNGRFDFIDKNYYRNINIEDITFCKKILLNFLYEYLKLNKDDIFYNELEWYYKFEDIEKIANYEIYDPMWCYTPPH